TTSTVPVTPEEWTHKRKELDNHKQREERKRFRSLCSCANSFSCYTSIDSNTPMKTLLLAGTKKGLFLFTSNDRKRWELHGPFQNGREINHSIYDSRSGRIYATANDAWFGCELVWSADLGSSWTTAKQNPAFPESSGQKLERIWHIEPGRPSEPQ